MTDALWGLVNGNESNAFAYSTDFIDLLKRMRLFCLLSMILARLLHRDGVDVQIKRRGVCSPAVLLRSFMLRSEEVLLAIEPCLNHITHIIGVTRVGVSDFNPHATEEGGAISGEKLSERIRRMLGTVLPACLSGRGVDSTKESRSESTAELVAVHLLQLRRSIEVFLGRCVTNDGKENQDHSKGAAGKKDAVASVEQYNPNIILKQILASQRWLGLFNDCKATSAMLTDFEEEGVINVQYLEEYCKILL
jgi:hypothetical protein